MQIVDKMGIVPRYFFGLDWLAVRYTGVFIFSFRLVILFFKEIFLKDISIK